MSERTTIRLPEELLERARHKAAAEGRTLTSLIEDGLRIVVSEPSKPKPKPEARSLPRISAAKGGLMPGIDLAAPASLQEIDDLAYLEQMKRSE
jgi:hypothetical protein